MKNRHFFYLALLVLLPIFFCACAVDILPKDELTEAEKMQVISRARKFIIQVNHFNISPDDKIFVKANMPKFYVKYTGYKRGAAKMVWRINPSYSIRIICNGDLLDKSCPTRMSISRFQM